MPRLFIVLLFLASVRADATWAFVQSSAPNVAEGSSTTVATTLTGVTAGNTLVVWIKAEGGTTSISVSDGTDSLTAVSVGIICHSNGDLCGETFYLLTSTASGSVTYTATFGAARTWRSIIVAEFSSDADETKSSDGDNENEGTGTSLTSGAITTSGTDDVAVGTFGEYCGTTSSSEQIGGTNADGRVQQVGGGVTSIWYRFLSGTMSSGSATATVGACAYISQIVALKSVSGGGGGGSNRRRSAFIVK